MKREDAATLSDELLAKSLERIQKIAARLIVLIQA